MYANYAYRCYIIMTKPANLLINPHRYGKLNFIKFNSGVQGGFSMDEHDALNNTTYDCLKLDNQLCFPLYACAKEIVRRYKPYLDELDLTYTQYICMMVIWEQNSLSVKELGERLYLDSGTLTPVLKKLEHKGFLTRKRSQLDERSLIVTVTDKGMDLREKAAEVPHKMGGCINISPEDAGQLYQILYKLLGSLSPQE